MTDQDLERGPKPLVTSTSWMSNFTTTRIPSVGFRRNSLSPKALSRIRTMEIQEYEKMGALTDAERQKQDNLIVLITGDQLIKGSLADSCLWYSRYLRSRFHNHWHLLAPALVGLEDNSLAPASGDMVVVYEFVLAVAKLLKNKPDLALVEIVDELENRGLLKQQLDDVRAIPNQVVFAALGWLTMLYEAVSHPKADNLEVTKTSTSSSGYRNPLVTKRYSSYKQGFDYIDSPFHSLLGRFGDLIPEAGGFQTHQPGSQLIRSSEVIMVQSVCFNTLQQIAELKIEWVTSLALHLELDSGKRTLKLFQSPSFCRLMTVKRKHNILTRLLKDHAARNCEDVRAPEVPTDDFFKEILLSYSLIFGQDERSYKAFARMVPVWEEQRGRSSWETTWDSDPMLHVLCGQSSNDEEARKIYDEIDANEPASYYNPHTEFPFFGKRLLELQQFIKQHQPHTVRSLLNDRRDLSAWYNLWNTQVLIAFATITIFLMIISMIFQIWQVMLAKDQIRLAQQQLMQPPI